MSTWVDNILEPDPDPEGESGMTIIPPADKAVGVMPPPSEEPAPAPAAKKKITWRDFTIEEHARAFLGVPAGSKMKLGKVYKNKYRATVYTPVGKGVVANHKITNSALLTITLGPDGYEIVNESGDEFQQAIKRRKTGKDW